eukprot:1161639-Pelagomonas_calceolata.AAC.15
MAAITPALCRNEAVQQQLSKATKCVMAVSGFMAKRECQKQRKKLRRHIIRAHLPQEHNVSKLKQQTSDVWWSPPADDKKTSSRGCTSGSVYTAELEREDQTHQVQLCASTTGRATIQAP